MIQVSQRLTLYGEFMIGMISMDSSILFEKLKVPKPQDTNDNEMV